MKLWHLILLSPILLPAFFVYGIWIACTHKDLIKESDYSPYQ